MGEGRGREQRLKVCEILEGSLALADLTSSCKRFESVIRMESCMQRDGACVWIWTPMHAITERSVSFDGLWDNMISSIAI